MGAVLRSLLACSFCVLLRGGKGVRESWWDLVEGAQEIRRRRLLWSHAQCHSFFPYIPNLL